MAKVFPDSFEEGSIGHTVHDFEVFKEICLLIKKSKNLLDGIIFEQVVEYIQAVGCGGRKDMEQ